jgi:hypothetical protein
MVISRLFPIKKILRMVLAVGLCSISFVSFSQGNSPVKANNGDLRNDEELFSIQEYGKTGQKVRYVQLVMNNKKEYTLFSIVNKELTRLRLSTVKMKEVDSSFVKKYFSLSYELAAYSSKEKCVISYELNLRGDKVQVCHGEEKKADKADSLITFLVRLDK